MPRPGRVCQLRQFAEAESPPPSCPQTIRIALSVQYTNPTGFVECSRPSEETLLGSSRGLSGNHLVADRPYRYESLSMNRINVLDNFLDPLGAMFTPEVAQRVVAFRVDASTQARIDTLADKCTEGQLTVAEGEEYDTYLMAIDFITVLQAKARTVLDHRVAS